MGEAFGGRAIELAGRVVRPEYQQNGVGLKMLDKYMRSVEQNLITTHTRNQAVLKVLATLCCSARQVYPIHLDEDGNCFVDGFNESIFGRPVPNSKPPRSLAEQIPGTSIGSDGIAYHVNRYGVDGLYGEGVGDPADRPGHGYPRLKDRFVGLRHPGTALVVVADFAYAREHAGPIE